MDWPENPEFAAVINEGVGFATTHRTFVLGVSMQDSNLQTLFTRPRSDRLGMASRTSGPGTRLLRREDSAGAMRCPAPQLW